MSERIAVIGAGVIGLSIAHELASAGRDVMVLADLEPLETTSAVAGAVWFPYAAERSAAVDAMLASTLRRFTAFAAERPEAGIDLRIPPIRYCTDNGAMIAALGAAVVRRGLPPSALDLAVDSSMPLTHVLV